MADDQSTACRAGESGRFAIVVARHEERLEWLYYMTTHLNATAFVYTDGKHPRAWAHVRERQPARVHVIRMARGTAGGASSPCASGGLASSARNLRSRGRPRRRGTAGAVCAEAAPSLVRRALARCEGANGLAALKMRALGRQSMPRGTGTIALDYTRRAAALWPSV